MPPDNAGYYHAAYVAAALIYVGYTVTLLVRASRVKARLGRMNADRQREKTE